MLESNLGETGLRWRPHNQETWGFPASRAIITTLQQALQVSSLTYIKAIQACSGYCRIGSPTVNEQKKRDSQVFQKLSYCLNTQQSLLLYRESTEEAIANSLCSSKHQSRDHKGFQVTWGLGSSA